MATSRPSYAVSKAPVGSTEVSTSSRALESSTVNVKVAPTVSRPEVTSRSNSNSPAWDGLPQSSVAGPSSTSESPGGSEEPSATSQTYSPTPPAAESPAQ